MSAPLPPTYGLGLVHDHDGLDIIELQVLVCLLLTDGLTVLSMWSEAMSGSYM